MNKLQKPLFNLYFTKRELFFVYIKNMIFDCFDYFPITVLVEEEIPSSRERKFFWNLLW